MIATSFNSLDNLFTLFCAVSRLANQYRSPDPFPFSHILTPISGLLCFPLPAPIVFFDSWKIELWIS